MRIPLLTSLGEDGDYLKIDRVIRNDLIKAVMYTFGVIAVIFIIMFFRYLNKRLERQ